MTAEHVSAVAVSGRNLRERGTDMYAVIENTPGYLPESEPAEFDQYAEAVAYANELADELEAEGYTTDRSVASRDNYYAIQATRSDTVAPDLGRVIEVVDLSEQGTDTTTTLHGPGQAITRDETIALGFALHVLALVIVPALTFVVRVLSEVSGVLS